MSLVRAVGTMLLTGVACGALASPGPWSRTEAREPCADFTTLRRPYVGDLHVHTGFSHDARLWITVLEPDDAYAFARGESVALPDADGAATREFSLDRALDFTAVTDHAEFFGEVRL